MDNILITTALSHLFSTLSAWEPNGNLLLDISVRSPSDSEHWFKYLTFGPDIPSECDRSQCAEQSILIKVDDHQHGWIAGSQDSTPISIAIHKVFDKIMGKGTFDDDEQENQWWEKLPLVPAVTVVLLRQRNRRRWKPTALAQMFARLPRPQEIHYEPRRECYDTQQLLRHCGAPFPLLCTSQTTYPSHQIFPRNLDPHNHIVVFLWRLCGQLSGVATSTEVASA